MLVNQIYISYAWKVEKQNHLVDKLEAACQKRGIKLRRDTSEINYKDSIHEYMNKLSSGKAIVLILSEAYFKSSYCMYELRKIYDRSDFHQRVFPIVIKDTPLVDPMDRVGYVRYWEEKITLLDKELREVSSANIKEIINVLDEYAENRRLISSLQAVIADMNVLTEGVHVDTDFAAVLNAITGRKVSVVGRYIIHGDGTVTDTETSLMWKQCSEGQSDTDCKVDDAVTYSWDEAMSKFSQAVSFADYADWRMPTREELHTLVETDQYPTISQLVFSNTPAKFYWSSSVKDISTAWVVSFSYGDSDCNDRNSNGRVRLVRLTSSSNM